MHDHPSIEPAAAVLVAVQLPGVSDEELEASLAELERLVRTLGHTTVARITQKRHNLAPGAVLGEGKLKELAAITGGKGVLPSSAPERRSKAHARSAGADEAEKTDAPDEENEEGPSDASDARNEVPAEGSPRAGLVVVDHEITPSQARNLEKVTGAQVLDRTGVIVEIFHRHAQSREARLQVEIARLTYVAPRLRESSGGGDRVRGGIGGKGAGESALELDRRKIRDRIAELRQELDAIRNEQTTRRARRRGQMRVALVGYTNAGKSSLMRALTGSEVLVADKLFATLDTTVRVLQPETRPRVLVSDTVGFIKKLPHDLVASFRSTLDEALEASLLLYVVDASDPTFRSQLEVTRGVLAEIGASEVPSKLVLNKIDRIDEEGRAALVREFPDAIQISAHDGRDVARLREHIVAFFEKGMSEAELFVPYERGGLIGDVHEQTRVLSEEYGDAGVRFRVRAPDEVLARLRAALSGSEG